MSDESAMTVPTGMMVANSGGGGVPYVIFVSPKSPNFADYAAAIPGVKARDILLSRPPPYPLIALPAFKFFTISAQQAWVEAEEDGTLISATFDDPKDRESPQRENIESVLIVFLPDGSLVPARCTFRTSKCAGMKNVRNTYAMAHGDAAAVAQWAALSPEHRETLEIPSQFAWGRFVTTMTCTGKTGGRGRVYDLTKSRVGPTNKADRGLLGNSLKDAAFCAALQSVNEAYVRRVTELRELAGA